MLSAIAEAPPHFVKDNSLDTFAAHSSSTNQNYLQIDFEETIFVGGVLIYTNEDVMTSG